MFPAYGATNDPNLLSFAPTHTGLMLVLKVSVKISSLELDYQKIQLTKFTF
jgi:hypothetical protein